MRVALFTIAIALACSYARSLADSRLIEEPVYLFIDNDRRGALQCAIDIHLWVSGPRPESCVRRLEQAAHTARFESWVRRTATR